MGGAADDAPSGLKVEVYEGPTECEDEHKVTSGKSVSMHYTGTIDQSSATGEKGKKFRFVARSGRHVRFHHRRGPSHQGMGPGHPGPVHWRQGQPDHSPRIGLRR